MLNNQKKNYLNAIIIYKIILVIINIKAFFRFPRSNFLFNFKFCFAFYRAQLRTLLIRPNILTNNNPYVVFIMDYSLKKNFKILRSFFEELVTTEVEVIVVDGGLETTEELKESIFKTHFPGTFIFDKEERLEMFVDKTSGNL